MALTTGGIEKSRELINQLQQNLDDVSRIQDIVREMEKNPDFYKFARSTKFGVNTLSKWGTLTGIVKDLSSLIENMCHNTLEYVKVQEQYNNNDFSISPNYKPFVGPKTPSGFSSGFVTGVDPEIMASMGQEIINNK